MVKDLNNAYATSSITSLEIMLDRQDFDERLLSYSCH